jgi:hypothetical protein
MSRLSKALAGPGYVILNVLRAINIITFLDIIAASVVMLIKISINNNFFFFEAVSHAFTTIMGGKYSSPQTRDRMQYLTVAISLPRRF